MNTEPSEPRPPEHDEGKLNRDKLFGRLMLIGFLILILAYVIPTFMNARP